MMKLEQNFGIVTYATGAIRVSRKSEDTWKDTLKFSINAHIVKHKCKLEKL